VCRYSTGKQSGPASSSRRVVPASAPLPHPSSASNAANGSSSCPSPFVSGAASAQGLTRHGVPLYAHSVPVYQCTSVHSPPPPLWPATLSRYQHNLHVCTWCTGGCIRTLSPHPPLLPGHSSS
jgi:hypothetical protein